MTSFVTGVGMGVSWNSKARPTPSGQVQPLVVLKRCPDTEKFRTVSPRRYADLSLYPTQSNRSTGDTILTRTNRNQISLPKRAELDS